MSEHAEGCYKFVCTLITSNEVMKWSKSLMLLLITTMVARASAACLGGKVLYNGICWRGPMRRTAPPVDPELPPYVLEPPAVINISLGRQLFVDTFLINDSATTPPRSWRITYHQASYGDDEESLLPYLSPWESWSVCVLS